MTDPLITDEAAELNRLHADLMLAAEENRGFYLTKRRVVLLAGWFADHEECDERVGYDQGRADATREIVQAIEAAEVGGSWVDFVAGYREAQSRHAALARSIGGAVREVGPKSSEETP